MAPLLVVLLLLLGGCARDGSSVARWHKLELSFEGPPSASAGEVNPFAIRFDVHFSGPEGTEYRVPGFYDGNGRGGRDGSAWKIRFAPDRNGEWTWRTVSSEPLLNGKAGQFVVTDPPAGAPELYRLGRLEYAGARYLKFREGGYWLKAGADEPENLLGDAFGRDDWAAKKRQIDYLAKAGINSSTS